MEPEAKDGEEEHLQTAFKKLRVDAEGSTVSLCEGTSRTSSRTSVEDTKAKVVCASKESWHGSARKNSRGTSRNPRRRRSKSPILHPPKFTHCSSKTPICSTVLKHKSQLETLDSTVGVGIAAKKELAPSLDILDSEKYGELSTECSVKPTSGADDAKQKSARSLLLESSLDASQPSDFQLVSKFNTTKRCRCKDKEECQCKHWKDMEVYSFSGLRNIISECEKTAVEDYSQSIQNRFQMSSTGPSGSSPRSCSEQARASVDDVTIEDLSGYMEYYFYIPKEMSYMAEMMYT